MTSSPSRRVSVSDQRSVAITPGREVIGAVLSLDEKAITVRSAPDGGTALRSVAEHTPDAVVLDHEHGRAVLDDQ